MPQSSISVIPKLSLILLLDRWSFMKLVCLRSKKSQTFLKLVQHDQKTDVKDCGVHFFCSEGRKPATTRTHCRFFILHVNSTQKCVCENIWGDATQEQNLDSYLISSAWFDSLIWVSCREPSFSWSERERKRGGSLTRSDFCTLYTPF